MKQEIFKREAEVFPRTGQIIKCVAGVFTVCSSGEMYEVFGRGKTREGKILPGDLVEFDAQSGAVESVKPRKNSLVRPAVANVDLLAILLAPSPKPDLYLADKLIIFAHMNHIEPLLVYNKTDLDAGTGRAIMDEYKDAGVRIIDISAKSGYNVDAFLHAVSGKFVCLCGQSAVGKSTLINSILNTERMETGGLSD
ncbi:MAG: GTPase RsgA, partial [Firmicutes bacterium]|nr:GTPase RsgA [Bacillota bacterium]